MSRPRFSVLRSSTNDRVSFSIRIPSELAQELRELRRTARAAGCELPLDDLIVPALQKIAVAARAELDAQRTQGEQHAD